MWRTVLLTAGVVLCLWGQGAAAQQFRIGFSQVTTAEPWRVLFNKQLREAAGQYPQFQLMFADAQDRTEKQVADVQAFIQQGVDVILLAPKESAGLSWVVEEAREANIPVIVLDRRVDTPSYTQFIGGDNLEIGRQAGRKARDLLGGDGSASGSIVEIWGGMGSTPAHERHRGFAEVVASEPGVRWLVERQDGDWKQDRAYNIMTTALRAHPKIDLVYAHNDPMAFGAYLAAKDAGREKEMYFLGVDAIPREGALWVKRGFLTATFVYPTPGAEALRQVQKLLNGEALDRELSLPTATVDAQTVDAYLQRYGQ